MTPGTVALVAMSTALLLGPPAAAAPPTTGGTIELADAGARLRGAGEGARAGWAVALLPDAVASGEPGNIGDDGAVRIMPIEVTPGSRVPKKRGTVLRGPEHARTGRAIAATTDYNGDGDSALLVGAPAGDGESGIVYAVFAPTDIGDVRLEDAGRAVATIRGAAPGDKLGAAVAWIPDIDGDKRRELLLGAPGASPMGRERAGAAYVISSSLVTPGATIELSDPASAMLAIAGPRRLAEAGRAVGNVEDGGGLLIGAPGIATAFVLLGSHAGVVDLATEPSLIRLVGPPGSRAGWALAVPGQVAGDALPDIAVGAPAAGTGSLASSGAVYIAAGRTAPGTVQLGIGPTMMRGAARNDKAGTALAAAGDVDGDGIGDLLVGAPGASPLGRPDAGAAYLVFGSVPVDLALLGRSGVRIVGKRRQRVGTSVAGGLDVAGRSDPDVVIGAPGSPRTARVGVAALLSNPRRPFAGGRGGACSHSLAVVLDDSDAIRDEDEHELRAEALELLLDQPANDERLVNAVEMTTRPVEIFSPLVIGSSGYEDQSQTVDKLVEKTIGDRKGRDVSGTDLDAGVHTAVSLGARTEAALVIAGDATTPATPPPGVRVDVLAVDVARPSPAEQRLRALATTSDGGQFMSIGASAIQAAAALIDAPQRCQQPQPIGINGRRVDDPSMLDAVATMLRSNRALTSTLRVLPGRPFADYVISWDDPSVKLPAPAIDIRPRGRRQPMHFSRREVKRALDGSPRHSRLINGERGATWMTLRIRLTAPDVSAVAARPYGVIRARHRHRRIRGGSSAVQPVRAYPQFFVGQ